MIGDEEELENAVDTGDDRGEAEAGGGAPPNVVRQPSGLPRPAFLDDD